MDGITLKRFLMIDNALYNPQATGIRLDGVFLPIKTAVNFSRYITWNNNTFIQEPPKANKRLGRMRLDGHQITRIMRPNRPWGLILNGNIEKE